MGHFLYVRLLLEAYLHTLDNIGGQLEILRENHRKSYFFTFTLQDPIFGFYVIWMVQDITECDLNNVKNIFRNLKHALHVP